MNQAIVTTKEELKNAIDQRIDEIIIRGELTLKVKKARTISKSILILVLVAPMVLLWRYLPLGATGPVGTPDVSIPKIIAAASVVGLALVYAIHKDYEEIKFILVPPEIIIRKKAKEEDK